jgi:hypothetical protein
MVGGDAADIGRQSNVNNDINYLLGGKNAKNIGNLWIEYVAGSVDDIVGNGR